MNGIFATLLALILVAPAYAETICIKSQGKLGRNSKVTITNTTRSVPDGTRCPKGFKVLLQSSSGPQGPAGEQGPPGATGAEGVYGDGSKGDLVTAAGLNFLTDFNTQYNNITIPAGSSLFIPSGTTLKCLGNFEISGTLVVQRGAIAGVTSVLGTNSQATASVFGNQALSGTGLFEVVGPARTDQAAGGKGAKGMLLPQSTPTRMLVRPSFLGGGAGGSSGSSGGDGGGFGAVLCQGHIIANPGSNILSQVGTPTSSPGSYIGGGGGAGGGIIILASRMGIINNGTISAVGSNGAPAGSGYHSGTQIAYGWGPGGGGGGGIIHLISPSIVAGTLNVTGGNAGSSASSITYSSATSISIIGGGGGGSGYGSGGNAGFAEAQLNTKVLNFGSAQAGEAGVTYQTTADPTELY